MSSANLAQSVLVWHGLMLIAPRHFAPVLLSVLCCTFPPLPLCDPRITNADTASQEQLASLTED